uniref:Uncharacterized protein n=1 Tax=Arundo donax TaxID=35708 RepID=A0A0A9HJE7_ARUDO
MEQPNPQVQPGIRPSSFSITSTTVTDHMNFLKHWLIVPCKRFCCRLQLIQIIS